MRRSSLLLYAREYFYNENPNPPPFTCAEVWLDLGSLREHIDERVS